MGGARAQPFSSKWISSLMPRERVDCAEGAACLVNKRETARSSELLQKAASSAQLILQRLSDKHHNARLQRSMIRRWTDLISVCSKRDRWTAGRFAAEVQTIAMVASGVKQQPWRIGAGVKMRTRNLVARRGWVAARMIWSSVVSPQPSRPAWQSVRYRMGPRLHHLRCLKILQRIKRGCQPPQEWNSGIARRIGITGDLAFLSPAKTTFQWYSQVSDPLACGQLFFSGDQNY